MDEDIVERLRKLAWPGSQWNHESLAMIEAADEIERLRKKLKEKTKKVRELNNMTWV